MREAVCEVAFKYAPVCPSWVTRPQDGPATFRVALALLVDPLQECPSTLSVVKDGKEANNNNNNNKTFFYTALPLPSDNNQKVSFLFKPMQGLDQTVT